MSNTERTLSIIKPDALERNSEEEIKTLLIKKITLRLKTVKKYI